MFFLAVNFIHGLKAVYNVNIYKSDSKPVEVKRCLVLDFAQNSPDISGNQRSVPGKCMMGASKVPEEARIERTKLFKNWPHN